MRPYQHSTFDSVGAPVSIFVLCFIALRQYLCMWLESVILPIVNICIDKFDCVRLMRVRFKRKVAHPYGRGREIVGRSSPGALSCSVFDAASCRSPHAPAGLIHAQFTKSWGPKLQAWSFHWWLAQELRRSHLNDRDSLKDGWTHSCHISKTTPRPTWA